MENMQTLVVHRPGLPPWLSIRQVSGINQGGAADASAGLSKITTDADETWAWNPVDGEWQLLHIIRSGDTLWNMGGHYYGQRSRENVHRIGNVQQNKPIVGNDYASCVPGDILLIPGLAQPADQPALPPGGGASPPGGGLEPPAEGGDWGDPPAGWDPNLPWPPVTGGIGLPVEPPAEGGEGADDGEQPAEGEPVSAITPAEGEKKGFWTTGKIVAAAGGGVALVALIAFLATRKPKRRRAPSRRRRSPPRRRRRR
jgi:hypothetical protein